MKYLIVLCLLSLSACGPLTEEEVFNNAKPSAVRILTDEGNPMGSGFVLDTPVGERVVVTNDHVCGDKKELRLRFTGLNNLETIAERIVTDYELDLCLIKVPNLIKNRVSPLHLAKKLEDYSLAYAIGYPLEYDLTISHGFTMIMAHEEILSPEGKCEDPIVSIFGTFCVKKMYLMSSNVIIYPGNSGSAALNEYGEVIGVFNSGSSLTHWGNIIPLTDLKKFIKGE